MLFGGIALGLLWTLGCLGGMRLGLLPGLTRSIRLHPPLVVLLMPFDVLIVALPLALFLGFRGRRRSLESLVSARGWLCLNCRYRLDPNIAAGRCPECGEPFDAGILKRGWCRAYRELAYEIDWPAPIGPPA